MQMFERLPFLRPRLTWAYNKIEAALTEVEGTNGSAHGLAAAEPLADGVNGA